MQAVTFVAHIISAAYRFGKHFAKPNYGIGLLNTSTVKQLELSPSYLGGLYFE